jgi:isopentenyl-diphosphate delta-isomerase type 1
MISDEVFDVVNERDEVVGQQVRSQVHRLGLMHRAVHVLIFNGRGQVFLQKRSMSKDTFPGAWDSSASGHVDQGEAYDACALRELMEELGVVPERAPEPLYKISACAETGWEFIWVYRMEHEGPFNLHPGEIEDGRWFEPGEVTAWIRDRPEEIASALRLIWGRSVSSA